jgi:hypothetical protein
LFKEGKGDGTLVQGREIIWKLSISIQRREEKRNRSSEEGREKEP